MSFKVRDGRSLPFFQVDNKLIDDCDLDVQSKLIYVALCRYSNNGSAAFPSFQKIADVCNISRSTAIRRINELVEKGYIEKVDRIDEKTGSKTSNLYTILDIPSVRQTPPPVSDRHHPSVSVTPPLVSDRHHPSVSVTPYKEQVKKNNVKKNKLSQLVDEQIKDGSDLENIQNNEQTDEQKLICDLQALNIPTTNAVVETVRDWTESHEIKLLQAVIDKCVATSKNGINLNYLKKAVDALTTKNIKTIEDLERAEELRSKTFNKQNTRVEIMHDWNRETNVVADLSEDEINAKFESLYGSMQGGN